ncbi:TIGR00282 family metallophosphoesterase [candidate division WS5 bacterium]|uniref:TIGR00282 family metallophosphoesterase n=1 Tax=candidate division WS5 bacterium TaxID=2093353 RepID=A0A419DGD7_9BACT|nr:MAG: TIGR00282 family metallophosphoesterase [candidate division WS5 bacterium]
MKILFIADIVGKPGRQIVKEVLPELKKEEGIDFVIANGENMTSGNGMTKGCMEELLDVGVDFFTTGNHIWKKPEFFSELDKKETPVIRPANYPPDSPGVGYKVVKTVFGKILIVDILGRQGINANVENPFSSIDEILKSTKGKYDLSIVDFHAEVTSEKVAFGLYLDGRVNAVIGTHTHVPTADERIMPKGTAYISDAGMTGVKESVLGVKKDIIIELFKTGIPQKFEQETKGPRIFNSILIEIEKGGKTISIQRVRREV